MWWNMRYFSPRATNSQVIQLLPRCSTPDSRAVKLHRLNTTQRAKPSASRSADRSCDDTDARLRRPATRAQCRSSSSAPISGVAYSSPMYTGCGVSSSHRAATPARSRADHLASYSSTRALSLAAHPVNASLETDTDRGLFSGQGLHSRGQPIQRGCVSTHDSLPLRRGETVDRVGRRVVTPVRIVGREHQVVAQVHHFQILAEWFDVGVFQRLGGEPDVFADILRGRATDVRQVGAAGFPDPVHP